MCTAPPICWHCVATPGRSIHTHFSSGRGTASFTHNKESSVFGSAVDASGHFNVHFSPHQFDYASTITILVDGHHFLGLNVVFDYYYNRFRIHSCFSGKSSAKIRQWRTLMRHKYIHLINDTIVDSPHHFL